ncbi:MAG: hypothetical protein HC819_11940 [Cyclobacteriaceae bacterium]|nr:hypothetical protein [Cyclobacteriaceae bacterium]
MDFIEAGGGFVVIHAASATFYDWPEYQQMVGTTWGDSTGHSAASPHKIVIKDNTHPVTRGMTDFWITDELWVNAGINAELHILAESFSDTTNAGRVVMEPVMHWKEVGKGRVFHSILGHDDRAMKNTAWQTLLLRGTEWAATANVTIALPPDLQTNEQVEKNRYSWLASDSSIALLNQGEIMWQYNYLTVKGKPYFHPVRINNSTLTWLSPEDHPWHLGIWHSWKYINDVNYWEYDLSEGVEPFNYLGITEVRDIQIEKGSDFSCVMHLQIAYHEKNGPDLMLDNRKIMVSPPDSAGLYFIDFQLDISALADSVELNRTPLAHEPNGQSWGGYGGLSIRFHPDLFDPQFINPDGSTDMKHGEPQAWKFFGLRNIFGDNIGIAVFTESGNLSHPEPWFMSASNDHPFYFFGPSPLFYNPYTLESGDRLQLGYRMQFYVGDTDKDLLARDYQTFLNK